MSAARAGLCTGPNGAFTIEAIGTIDNDTDNDVWLISSGTIDVTAGPCAETQRGVAGIATSMYNDVFCP